MTRHVLTTARQGVANSAKVLRGSRGRISRGMEKGDVVGMGKQAGIRKKVPESPCVKSDAATDSQGEMDSHLSDSAVIGDMPYAWAQVHVDPVSLRKSFRESSEGREWQHNRWATQMSRRRSQDEMELVSSMQHFHCKQTKRAFFPSVRLPKGCRAADCKVRLAHVTSHSCLQCVRYSAAACDGRS